MVGALLVSCAVVLCAGVTVRVALRMRILAVTAQPGHGVTD